jgi:hypothetical protein
MGTLALSGLDENMGFSNIVLEKSSGPSGVYTLLLGAGDVWMFPAPPRPDDFYREYREGRRMTGDTRHSRIDYANVRKGHADLQ